MSFKRFVILDRDGTVIVERNYLSSPDQVELLPMSASGLRRLTELGLGLVIVTNQSGVGRGLFTLDQVHAIHARMIELFENNNAAYRQYMYALTRQRMRASAENQTPS